MSAPRDANAIGLVIVSAGAMIVLVGLARLSSRVDPAEPRSLAAVPPAPAPPRPKEPAPDAAPLPPFDAPDLFQLASEVRTKREWHPAAPASPDPFGNGLALQAIIGADRAAQVIVNGTPVAVGETFEVAGKSVKLVAVTRGEARFQLGDVIVRRVLAPLPRKSGSP
jgi:hypothetical protein